MSTKFNIAIVGATGTVGAQIIECLDEREFPLGSIRFLGTGQGVGQVLEFKGKPGLVEELTPDSFAGTDIAFFAGGSDCSREFCLAAVRAGAVCIDTSTAWRMDPDVPLVVPEVNADDIARYTKKGIIANPGSCAIQLAVALKPLHDAAGIRRVVVSTCQAVSGTGREAVGELDKQVRDLFNGRQPSAKVYPHQVAFNCLPQIDAFDENGYTREEVRIVNETRKVMGADVRLTVTAIRVPVFYGDAASVNIETEQKLSVASARGLLQNAPGVELVDDPAERSYPMPISAAGHDEVFVGRIREDETAANGLNLWITADNIRKGAATNAVQIAEIVVGKYLKR